MGRTWLTDVQFVAIEDREACAHMPQWRTPEALCSEGLVTVPASEFAHLLQDRTALVAALKWARSRQRAAA